MADRIALMGQTSQCLCPAFFPYLPFPFLLLTRPSRLNRTELHLHGFSFSSSTSPIEFVKDKPLFLLKRTGKNPYLPSILLNSHTDVVLVEAHKWSHPPFVAKIDPQDGNIYVRGSQDMKYVGLQYLEAIRKLKDSNFEPLRTIYMSFVPDEEVGGHDGPEKFANSKLFDEMNVGIVLDEGLALPEDYYRLFYAERCPMWLVIKASGAPGHGAKLYDNTTMENLVGWRQR